MGKPVGLTGRPFLYGKGICEKKPVGPEKLHDLPVAHASQAIAFYQAEFFAQAADILKPDLVFHPVPCIAEPWGHGSAVKKDFSIVFNCYLDGFYVADGIGFALASYVGEGPVVAVIGYAQIDFFGRDFCYGVFHHLDHFVEGRDGHRRTVGICALMLLVFYFFLL